MKAKVEERMAEPESAPHFPLAVLSFVPSSHYDRIVVFAVRKDFVIFQDAFYLKTVCLIEFNRFLICF